MRASISILIAALLTSPLVSAHGKVAVVTGDLGGNGTALGIKGAVVAGAGPNSKTELDTTTFNVVCTKLFSYFPPLAKDSSSRDNS